MATVLIIDDDPQILELLKTSIEECGHVALLAGGGKEAMTLLRYEPQIALVDLIMPGIDGLEVMAAIRVGSPRTRVVAMTGVHFENFDPLKAALEVGADAALRKPITPDDLSAEITRLLSETRR